VNSFAFIIHPIDTKRDVARKYPLLGRFLPEAAIDFFSRFWPPIELSHVVGARSALTDEPIEGWLIAVPYTPKRMLSLPIPEVYRKIIAAGHLAEELGAHMMGLGAYTSVVGDGGRTIAEALDIPVTTGDSYTAAVSVQAVRDAAHRMDIALREATLAVVGASGAIGLAVAQLLLPHVGRMLLIARDEVRLKRACAQIEAYGDRDMEAPPRVGVSTNVADIRRAEVVVTVTSSGGGLVRPEMLKPGSVVCDVSRPRDVSLEVGRARKDVLVIDGGLVQVPGDVDFGFDYGLPPGLTYGCLAETMTLAFEHVDEDFSIGKRLSLDRVTWIDERAAEHGFRLAALRSFEHRLDDAVIQQVRARVNGGGRDE
jgi:fatty aldehyde-generating acyl-ACP reductase